jgi:hypothetical protein
MENNETQPNSQELKQPKRKSVKTVLGGIALIMLIGLTALTVYIWQQQKINTLENENVKLSSQPSPLANDNPKPAQTLIIFKRDSVPFTFEYPKNWAISTDEPLDADFPAPDGYSIKLAAPGSDVQTNRFGNNFVKTGSRIVIYSVKSELQDINSRFTGIYRSVADKKEISIAGIKAVQYNFGYESDPAIVTELIKGGRMYTFSFYSDSEKEKDNAAYPVYEALLKSIKFE